MAVEGKDTSEFFLAKWSSYINIVVMVVTAVISILPDGSPWALAAGAVVAAANSLLSSSYSKSRAVVKASVSPLAGS